MSKKRSDTKTFRYDMGYAILRLMEKQDDLPLPNIHLLAKTMQEYYYNYNGQDASLDMGGKWKPSQKYWRQNIGEICKYMSNEYKIYFGFLRTKGLKGIWKFMSKDEYQKYLKFSNQDISTRVVNQNIKIDLAAKKWKIDIPKIAEVPKITN